MQYYHTYASSVGILTMISDGENLKALRIEGQKYFEDLSAMKNDASLPVFAKTAAWLDAYFLGRPVGIDTLPLSPEGSLFRLSVWERLQMIPFGASTTYGKIADEMRALGLRACPRSVGGAVAHNPVSVIIPCHRVLGSDGKLTGYAGGLDVKVKLLTHEGIIPSSEGSKARIARSKRYDGAS